MKLTAFIEYHNASMEELCRSYQELRREEDVIRAKISAIRQELESRGFFPSKEEIYKTWELYKEAHNDKS